MQGGADLFDGQTATRHPAACRLAPPALYIDVPGAGTRIWPLLELFLAAPPAPGAPLTIGCNAYPGHRLVLRDGTLADALVGSADTLRRGLRRFTPWTSGQWLAGVAAAALSVTVLVLALRIAPSLIAPLVPYQWEVSLGSRLLRVAGAHTTFCHTEKSDAALRRLGATLAQAAGWDRPLDIRIANIGVTNAVTLPGGHIVIFRGLIDDARSGDEVAGVFAHELGHVVRRHSMQHVLSHLGLTALLTMVTGGATGDVNTAVANYGAGLFQLSYTRDAERDADAFALATLRKAGLRSDGLGSFFEHLDEKRSADVPPWLRTHPTTAERIDTAKVQGAGGAAAFSDDEWQAIRNACSGPRKASPFGGAQPQK